MGMDAHSTETGFTATNVSTSSAHAGRTHAMMGQDRALNDVDVMLG